MKRIKCTILCWAMGLLLIGCGDSSSNNGQNANTEAHTIIEENELNSVVYAEDDVVNEFIIHYNELSEEDFTDIRKGNIRTKYYAFSYGYYCELLNSNVTNKINVSISQTNDTAEAGVAGMRDIFRDVVKTIDSSLIDDEIYACFDQLIAEGHLKEGVELGSTTIMFAPDVQLSGGYTRGHISIDAQ